MVFAWFYGLPGRLHVKFGVYPPVIKHGHGKSPVDGWSIPTLDLLEVTSHKMCVYIYIYTYDIYMYTIYIYMYIHVSMTGIHPKKTPNLRKPTKPFGSINSVLFFSISCLIADHMSCWVQVRVRTQYPLFAESREASPHSIAPPKKIEMC